MVWVWEGGMWRGWDVGMWWGWEVGDGSDVADVCHLLLCQWDELLLVVVEWVRWMVVWKWRWY